MTVLAAVILLAVVASAWMVRQGVRSLTELHRVEPLEPERCPSVTIIVPARNEEHTVAQALESLLALDYPRLEIVVVNDRSTDGTGRVLAEISARNPRLRLATVEELPERWLGKPHALRTGMQPATGEYLLFTDADIVMEPASLRRAMRHALENGLDHLTAGPNIVTSSPLLQCLVIVFAWMLNMTSRPWKARDPKSRASIGIGAFNLVKRSSFTEAGGMEKLRLEVLDDLMLGRMMKRAGKRQDFVIAQQSISVEWYPSTPAMIRGLEKNAFAANDYSLVRVTAGTVLAIMLYLLPVAGLALLPSVAGWLFLAALAAQTAAVADLCIWRGRPAYYALLFPFGVLMLLVTIWNSTVRTLLNGGVSWRGTHYPLEVLRGG